MTDHSAPADAATMRELGFAETFVQEVMESQRLGLFDHEPDPTAIEGLMNLLFPVGKAPFLMRDPT